MTGVWQDEAAGCWLLEMRSACYAFALADDGAAVRHLHWGSSLGREAVGGLAEQARGGPGLWERRGTWARELADEYVPWGGMRYDEPSLKVDYHDGTRGIEWQYSGQRSAREGAATAVMLNFKDITYGLEASLAYRGYDDFDVVERWATFRNSGDFPFVIRQAHSANWWLPRRDGWRLRYLHGGWGAETQLAEAALGPAKLVLESRRGMTSHQLNPWFSLDPDGSASEESGDVWSGALAWSGSWKLVFEQTSGARLHACGGWNDFDWAYHLAPGQELVTPSFAGLYTDGGFGAASREWHAWQRAHVLGRGDRTGELAAGWAPQRRRPHPTAADPERPAGGQATTAAATGTPPVTTTGTQPGTTAVADGQPAGSGLPASPPVRPVLYNSWEATAFSVSVDGQARLAELAARLGIECFVVDDGWFTGRHHDRAGLGDWAVDRSKFPDGLTPLIDKVNGLGMRFGLWVEPEMVNPDSDLFRTHPDWVYHFPTRTSSQHRNQLLLNLARPDVADWVFATLDRLLSGDNIQFIKWDANRHFSEPGWPAQAGCNPERAWVEHVHNLYAVLDGLRAAHPGVDFESCSGGGGRVDLGILGRTAQVWTSDNTDALDRITIQEGFTQVYAPQVMMAWVTDNRNPITGRRLPLRFRFHVAMAGSLGIGADLTEWNNQEMAEAAELIETYKSIRPTVQHGHLYRVASRRTGPLGAHQYLSSDGSEVVVLGWWGPRSYDTRLPPLRLAGLDPGAHYTDAGTGQQHWGDALMQHGLQLPSGTELDYGSALTRLARTG